MTVNVKRVRELLIYEPDTGRFFWRTTRGRCSAGTPAGCGHVYGYVRINIDGRGYGAHRLAWMFVHGETPAVIDHINGDRSDNRILNLRNVDHQINAENRKGARAGKKIPLMGVRKQTLGATYTSSIKVGGKVLSLGSFKTPEAAHEAYMTAKARHHVGAKAAAIRMHSVAQITATKAAA